MQRVQARPTPPPAPERKRLRAVVLIAALTVFGVCLLATSAAAKEGPTGPTGPPGATGATGPPGPEGKTATCLPSKATESGVWFASLAEPAGAPQDEVDGVVSYPVPLCKVAFPFLLEVEAVYLTEAESELPGTYTARGCEGSQNEAGAQPGHVCLFTANDLGATEAAWKNAKFRKFVEPDGVTSLESGTQGVRAVFWTKGFQETQAGSGTVPAGGAYLVAGGPWAVTAK